MRADVFRRMSELLLEASDLDAGSLGVPDESRMRDLIRAVGNMMASDCEPS